MRRMTGGAAIAGVVAAALFLARSGPEAALAKPTDEKITKFMREKLEASDKVLEGIVTENFDMIREGADKMILMSKAADWVVIQGPVYSDHSADFRRACGQLVKMAKEKKLEGAALAHMQVTMSCINCHAFVRSTKVAGVDAPRSGDGVARR